MVDISIPTPRSDATDRGPICQAQCPSQFEIHILVYILDFVAVLGAPWFMVRDNLAEYLQRAIGRRIAARRAAMEPRMTQLDLAHRTDGALSRSSIANIENGRQRIAIHHVYHLARALELEPTDLLPPSSDLPTDGILSHRRIQRDQSAEEFTRLVLGEDELTRRDEPRHED